MRKSNVYPHLLADLNGDGAADIIGFGGAGAYIAPANGFASVTPGAPLLADKLVSGDSIPVVLETDASSDLIPSAARGTNEGV